MKGGVSDGWVGWLGGLGGYWSGDVGVFIVSFWWVWVRGCLERGLGGVVCGVGVVGVSVVLVLFLFLELRLEYN